MGPFVLLHVALVGFFCCAALYSAWTWWHARADRTLLLFAGQCLLSVVLSANFVLIATASDVGRANIGLKRPPDRRAHVHGRHGADDWPPDRLAPPRLCERGRGVRGRGLGVSPWDALDAIGVTTLARVTLAWGETIAVPSRTGISWIIFPTYGSSLRSISTAIIGAAKLYSRDRLGAMLVGLAAQAASSPRCPGRAPI